MVASIILIAMGILCGFFFERNKLKNKTAYMIIFKMLTSSLFVLLGIYSWFCSNNKLLGLFVLPALVFGLLGDTFLALKKHFREHYNTFLYFGFIAFGFGHLMYLISLVLTFYDDSKIINILYIIIPIVVSFLIALVFILLEKKLKLSFGSFKPSVFAYMGLLLSFVFVSMSLLIMTKFQNTTLILISVGSILFAISDAILSYTYFGKNHNRPIDHITNALTYFSAQYVIAFSLFFI